MTAQRNILVDELKAYACLLVAFGHVIMGIRKAGVMPPVVMEYLEIFIWTFHVGLFMFLSGYVLYITGGRRSKSKINFIAHKLLNLGIPYLVFSCVYVVINSLTPGVNNESGIRDILLLGVKPVAQYWFLYALFFLFVIWTIFSDGNRKKSIILTLVCVGLDILGNKLALDFGFLNSTISMACLFGLGNCTRILDGDTKKNKGVILAHFLFVGLAIKFGLTNDPVISKILAFLGTVASVVFISNLCVNRFIEAFLLVINQYSFPIYLLHTIFTAATRILLLRLGYANYWGHVLIGSVVAVVCPIICMKIAEHSRYLTFLFYPSKGLRLIQENKKY